MKALIGIDRLTDSQPILDLFARLGFEDCRVTLTRVLAAVAPASSMPHVTGGVGVDLVTARTSPVAIATALERDSERLLEQEHRALYELGIHSEIKLLYGHPAEELIKQAEEMGADLVAASSTVRGPVKSAFLGSVCRALTINAPTSVLMAKKPPRAEKPFTAVLAADHSDYCNRAVDKLFGMRPMGIQRMIVMSASPQPAGPIPAGWHEYLDVEDDYQIHTRDLQKKCGRLADRFRQIRIEADAEVIEKPVIEAINLSMEEHDADLLILAAQGHGFIERMSIGSVSLHEAVAEPHSLLIMR